jgi:hypothetical protein
MALSLTGQGFVAGSVVYGAGRHVGDIDPDIYSKGMKLNFITQPIYLWVICIVKLSIGFSLLRIASTRYWKIAIWSVMGFMAFYTLGCFFVGPCHTPFTALANPPDHHVPVQRHPRPLG